VHVEVEAVLACIENLLNQWSIEDDAECGCRDEVFENGGENELWAREAVLGGLDGAEWVREWLRGLETERPDGRVRERDAWELLDSAAQTDDGGLWCWDDDSRGGIGALLEGRGCALDEC